MTHCAVDGCEAPKKNRGWCNRHYLRWYRHGDPTWERVRHRVCVIDDCQQVPKSTGKGFCEKHRSRIRTHGDPEVVTPRRRPIVAYQAAHDRLRVDRGPARKHSCVDCGGPAQQWSYNYGDPSPLMSPEGFPYSLDQSYYEPRCRGCHTTLDRYTELIDRRATTGKRETVKSR